ncbi:MAG TPA: hypothetical protein VG186_18880 [Solirubrobacteraceae bacterium]|nr:hypothetical protein [Solirubrobacteraceae bacterium]
MASRKELKEQAREERLAREAALAAAARRRRVLTLGGAGAVAVVAIVVAAIVIAGGGGGGGASASQKVSKAGSTPQLKLGPLASLGPLQSPGAPGPAGPEGVPIPAAPELAGTASGATGATVDQIGCLSQEQIAFHIHAHLTIFVNGTPRQIPYAIGITQPKPQSTPQGTFIGGGNCFYWLHTHAADGIVHIESPVQRTYTLGNFFDVWGQPLGPRQVGSAKGPVTAIYNGKLYDGNPRDIPLTAHAQIQLEVGRPLVAPVAITFPSGL